MKSEFELRILRQHWIQDDGRDNENDLCSHGEVYLRIGDEELSNHDSGSWTLSTTGLYLMRSINNNYEVGSYGSQLLPCCGHCFIADPEKESVILIGCPRGIDWRIIQIKNEAVKHISASGAEGIISKTNYQRLVLKFVNEVEEFYQKNQPKKMPEDEFDRMGYEAFWNEWNRLKQRIRN